MGLESHAKEVMGKQLVGEIRNTRYVQGNLRYYFWTEYHRNRAYSKLKSSGQFNPSKIGTVVLGFKPMR